MDWKREAIEKLEQYETKLFALQSIPQELSRLELELAEIQCAPVCDREDDLLSVCVKHRELESTLERAKLWVEIVAGGLEILSEDERLVLNRLFIYRSKNSVNRLCEELCVEKATVYRRRDQALRRFTIALYGTLES